MPLYDNVMAMVARREENVVARVAGWEENVMARVDVGCGWGIWMGEEC